MCARADIAVARPQDLASRATGSLELAIRSQG
jgi:hypothetical protein